MEKQKVVGGLADKKKEADFDPQQLEMGIKVEMEHTKDKKIAKEIAMDHLAEDPEYYSKLKKAKLEEKYTIKREDLLEEIKLRNIIKENIKRIYKNKKKENFNLIKEEYKLRSYIKKLILESNVGDKTPHYSTGINVLEQLLKKIIPVLEEDYKMLTSFYDQRKSYKNHIINSVQKTLTPQEVNDNIGTEVDNKINIKIDDEEKLQEVIDDEEITDSDKEKFIDIEKEKEPELPEDEAGDTTGRNLAMQTMEKIEKQILDYYGVLDNDKDKETFYDYLITNIKLYFDKWENELQSSVPEITNPEYEEVKNKEQSDNLEGDSSEIDNEIGLGGEEEIK